MSYIWPVSISYNSSMKPNSFLSFLLIMLFSYFQLKAQITFTNFKVDNNSSVDVYTGSQVPAQRHNFSVICRRVTNSNTIGDVFIHLVDKYGVVATTGIAGPITFGTTGNWVSNPDGFDYCTVTGQLSLDDGVVQYGLYNKMRAISFNTGSANAPYSNDVIINRIAPPPPAITSLSPPTGPTTTPFTVVANLPGILTQVSFAGINMGTNLSLIVPTGISPGSYPVTVTTTTGTSNAFNFTVTPSATTGPSISLSPTSGTPGSSIIIAAAGLQSWYAYSNISVTFNGVPIPYARGMNNSQILVDVPANATSGANNIVVNTATGSGTASFNVISLPPPTLSRVEPRNAASEGSHVEIRGANLLSTNTVTFNGISCTFQVVNSTSVFVQVPSGSYIGNRIGIVAVNTSQGTPTLPFTVLPQGPADIISLAGGLDGIRSGTTVYLQTNIDWVNYKTRGYSLPTITFNGISGTDLKIPSSAPLTRDYYYIVVNVPQGITSGLIQISNQFGIGAGLSYTVDALQTYIPCGLNTAVCSDQCVPYGSVPNVINGRVLADDNSPDFANYTLFIKTTTGVGNAFAQASEREWVQWQYSYTNNWDDWHNADSNATGASYQPTQPCTTTIYYRRVSSHIIYRFPTNHREEWYISEVVRITPRSIPPTPVQSTVTACTQATAVALAVNPVAPAVSYNWWVPYAGWEVSTDGLAPFSTFNQNTSFVTTGTNVVVTLPPSGVAPGTYPIAVSTNGACGGQTTDAIINIVVSSTGAAPTPVSAKFVRASGSTLCAPVYNLQIPAVAGTTSYAAYDVNGHNATGTIVQNITGTGQSVLFALNQEGPTYGYTATISATGPCGTGFYTTPVTNLNGPASKCGLLRSASVSTELYPNPASDKVTIVTSGKEGKVVFYDVMGVARKTAKLQAGSSELEIGLQDLPAGLYHVQVIISGQAPFDKQLIVQP